MSKRHQIVEHIESLKEIRAIMNSMKTLSMLEARKLTQAMPEQERVVSSTENMASDFIRFYSPVSSVPAENSCCLLVIGSERGFCGNFNERLVEVVSQRELMSETKVESIIAVGQKLCSRLDHHQKLIARLDGASVTEEIDNIIQQVLEVFRKLQSEIKDISLKVIYFHHETTTVDTLSLVPPFEELKTKENSETFPPLLNLDQDVFFSELVEQYLFYRLYEVFYSSLKTESQQRVRHLESAIERLDDNLVQLGRRNNMLRQEEIVEEIEIILLNSPTIKSGSSGSH